MSASQPQPAAGPPAPQLVSAPVVKQGGALWKKIAFRRTFAVLAIIAAAAVQYLLVNVPVNDIDQSGKFQPANVKAAEEYVSLVNPETQPGEFSFTYAGHAESPTQKIDLDAYFDNAQLSEETAQRLTALGIAAPRELASAKYVTGSARDGTCSTSISVQAGVPPNGSSEVQFYQKEVAPSAREHLLETKMMSSDATVTLSSQGTFLANGSSSCNVRLSIGQWEQVMSGFVPIKLRVPRGTEFRMRWADSDLQPSGWSPAGTPVRLLFGPQSKESFSAESIKVAPMSEGGESSVARLRARVEGRKGALLKVDSFRIGTDQLQVTASGKGRVYEDGKIVTTTNLLERMNKYPILAALFGAGNLALLGWAWRQFSRSSASLSG